MTSASESGYIWICPTCARRVPRAVQTCRCGYQAAPVDVAGTPDLPAAPIRGGSITVTRDDIDSAIADGLLTAEQAARLWDRFAARAGSRPKFDAAHVAYYAGAVIVLSALGWFLTEAWMNLGGGGIAVIAALYAGAFWLSGETLWKKGLTTPGGLLFTLAVWMVPLAIWARARDEHLPQDNPGSYRLLRLGEGAGP